MFNVQSVATATIRKYSRDVTKRLDSVHAEIDVCIDRDNPLDDSYFYKLLGKRDALVLELEKLDQLEQSLYSASSEELAQLVL